MRLKLDIRELKTFRTKHTINDLKAKKTINPEFMWLPFQRSKQREFFWEVGWGGGEGGIEMAQNVSSPAGSCCVLAF